MRVKKKNLFLIPYLGLMILAGVFSFGYYFLNWSRGLDAFWGIMILAIVALYSIMIFNYFYAKSTSKSSPQTKPLSLKQIISKEFLKDTESFSEVKPLKTITTEEFLANKNKYTSENWKKLGNDFLKIYYSDFRLVNLERAIGCFENCLEKEPKKKVAREAWTSLCYILCSTDKSVRDVDKAVFCGENAVKLGPRSYDAWYFLAKAHFEAKSFVEARNACEKYLLIDRKRQVGLDLLKELQKISL